MVFPYSFVQKAKTLVRGGGVLVALRSGAIIFFGTGYKFFLGIVSKSFEVSLIHLPVIIVSCILMSKSAGYQQTNINIFPGRSILPC